MEAEARVHVEHVDGRDVVRELHSAPPITLRSTLDGVHLVGSGAGPLGGDVLKLGVRVGPAARLHLASVAATLVQPGPSGAPSHLAVEIEVGEGATLLMRPNPAILVRGCDHRATTRVRLATGATMLWRDEVVLGRHAEPGGSVRQRLDLEVDGEPRLRTETAIGERWPGSLGGGGIGPARAVGSMLVVGDVLELQAVEDLALRLGGPASETRVAAMALEGPAVLVSAVGDRPSRVTGVLDRLWDAALGADRGTPARW
jgi:urease accessory protein